MHIKIYFNNKPLFLCDSMNGEPGLFIHRPETTVFENPSLPDLPSIIQNMDSEKTGAGVIIHSELPQLKNACWNMFTILQAAGGLVFNERQEMLFIFRRGRWDLPKGKLDPGESLEQCSIREVKEETGLQQVALGRFLLATYHTYHENHKHILKESFWYEMKAEGQQQLVPQTLEDINEARWVSKERLKSVMHQAFPSVHDVVKAIHPDEDYR